MITLQPASARARAMARPMPLLAPNQVLDGIRVRRIQVSLFLFREA
jgi:hypothetical protein